MSLRSELMSLMKPGSPQTGLYFTTLRQRLTRAGAALLDQVGYILLQGPPKLNQHNNR